VLILRTAGTNCDHETAHAWQLAGGEPERMHVRELLDHPARLRDYAILTIPGGFSYGDDIAAGKILANQLIHHLADALRTFVEAGRLVLGICNGFQVMVKAGLLPGGDPGQGVPQELTLSNNDSARFEARWVHLRSGGRGNAFLPPDTVLAMPIAHGEGKLVAASEEVRRRLREQGQIALTYCDASGNPGPYPINPNGSELDIAGITDPSGRVFGLMPHPERHVDPTQHPQWTRGGAPAMNGRVVFESAVRAAREV